MLGMPSNIGIKAEFKKKCVRKSLQFQKKLFTSWIRTHDLLYASQLHYPLSYRAVVFDGMLLEFSPLLRLQPTGKCNLISALTCGEKLEVRG